MEGWLVFLVIFVVLSGAAMMAVVYSLEKQRRQELAGAANRLGFSFSQHPEPGLLERLQRFRLFSRGRSRKIRNVMCRQIHDIHVTLFDYRYTTNSGRHSRSHDQTVVLFETKRLNLPFFTLRPENVFHKLGAALGYQDIDFENHPGFSEAFLLQGPDEAAIRDLFGDEVLAYFARHPSVCAEGDGSALIFYRGEKRVAPAQIEGFVEEGLDMLSATMEKEGELGILPWVGLGPLEEQAAHNELEPVWWE